MALPPAQSSQSEEEAQEDVGELDLPLGATEADKLLELDEKIRLCRSLVPASDLKCGRWSIDLARDVSHYIERIEEGINDLRTEVQTYAFGNTSSRNEADCKCQNRQGSAQIQVNAIRSEGGIKIYARCRKQPGVMEAAVDALEALDLDLVTASVKCCSCNHIILDAFGLQDGIVVQPEEVERCLIGTLSHNFMEV